MLLEGLQHSWLPAPQQEGGRLEVATKGSHRPVLRSRKVKYPVAKLLIVPYVNGLKSLSS